MEVFVGGLHAGEAEVLEEPERRGEPEAGQKCSEYTAGDWECFGWHPLGVQDEHLGCESPVEGTTEDRMDKHTGRCCFETERPEAMEGNRQSEEKGERAGPSMGLGYRS